MHAAANAEIAFDSRALDEIDIRRRAANVCTTL
jgi:hypothetical protein